MSIVSKMVFAAEYFFYFSFTFFFGKAYLSLAVKPVNALI